MITILFMIYVEKLKNKQKSCHILSKKGNIDSHAQDRMARIVLWIEGIYHWLKSLHGSSHLAITCKESNHQQGTGAWSDRLIWYIQMNTEDIINIYNISNRLYIIIYHYSVPNPIINISLIRITIYKWAHLCRLLYTHQQCGSVPDAHLPG